MPVLFTFYIQNVLKLKKNNSGAKGLKVMSSCVVEFRDHSYFFGCWWFLCKPWRFTPCLKNIVCKFLPIVSRGYISSLRRLRYSYKRKLERQGGHHEVLNNIKIKHVSTTRLCWRVLFWYKRKAVTFTSNSVGMLFYFCIFFKFVSKNSNLDFGELHIILSQNYTVPTELK